MMRQVPYPLKLRTVSNNFSSNKAAPRAKRSTEVIKKLQEKRLCECWVLLCYVKLTETDGICASMAVMHWWMVNGNFRSNYRMQQKIGVSGAKGPIARYIHSHSVVDVIILSLSYKTDKHWKRYIGLSVMCCLSYLWLYAKASILCSL